MDKALKDETQKKQPRVWLAGALLFFGFLAVFSGVRGLLDDKSNLLAPGGRIVVEVVDTAELQQLGLSGRQDLGDNSGMLFVFDDSSIERCFWMKDMNFAIDMVWLDSDKKVVHIENDVAPETYPNSFCPDQPAKYVLEVNAGRAEQLGITEDGVSLRF